MSTCQNYRSIKKKIIELTNISLNLPSSPSKSKYGASATLIKKSLKQVEYKRAHIGNTNILIEENSKVMEFISNCFCSSISKKLNLLICERSDYWCIWWHIGQRRILKTSYKGKWEPFFIKTPCMLGQKKLMNSFSGQISEILMRQAGNFFFIIIIFYY